MKYYILNEIAQYLKEKCFTLKLVKRIENNTLLMEFNHQERIYFDMRKGNSLIYKKRNEELGKKDFQAPFDTLLQKRFYNAKINDVVLHNDDKVLRFYVQSRSSYKSLTTILQLEFTGKHTNIIILDENEIILEALRHIDAMSSSRVIKVGEVLSEIPKQDFVPTILPVENIETLLFDTYDQKEQKELEQLKKQKMIVLSKNAQKIQKIMETLPQKEQLEQQSNELYEKGHLILNHLHEIKPYQTSINVFNFKGEEVNLSLDTKGNPSVYANELFKKAKRAKKKAQNVSIEKENLQQKSDFYHHMIHNINTATSLDEIEFLMPKKQKNQTKTKKAAPYESFSFMGYKIMLGTNEHSNIYLLQNAKASDFWFHMKDINSCHVIVQNTKKTLPIDVIYKAAQLCVIFSTSHKGKYLVDFTQRRNVKVQHKANVLYNPYDTIDVHIK
jgi:predicted ribosome quality control (RQC) complex YloA/Tae2 family protein